MQWVLPVVDVGVGFLVAGEFVRVARPAGNAGFEFREPGAEEGAQDGGAGDGDGEGGLDYGPDVRPGRGPGKVGRGSEVGVDEVNDA